MKHVMKLFALVGLAALGGVSAHAGEPAKRLTVLELCTSQSCYSCPQAEAYLAEKHKGLS